MKRTIRIFLVGTEELRADLRHQLAGSQYAVVGEAGFRSDALPRARDLQADLIVVSVDEPLVRSFRTIELLSSAVPEIPIIAAASADHPEWMRKAMRAGASDFLVKPICSVEQHHAILTLCIEREKRGAHTAGLGRGDVITIFGPKGGVGKTTLAINLATALALETQQRASLIDLDLQAGDVGLLMDARSSHTLADVAQTIHRCDAEPLDHFFAADSSGVHVLPAPRSLQEMHEISPEQVDRIVDAAAGIFDYVIADAGSVLTDPTFVALERSTLILLVTTLEWTRLKRTKGVLDLLIDDPKFEDRVKLIINNRIEPDPSSLADLQAEIDYPIFWQLPFDPSTLECARTARPNVVARPDSPYARSIVDLARSVSGLEPTLRPQEWIWHAQRETTALEPTVEPEHQNGHIEPQHRNGHVIVAA